MSRAAPAPCRRRPRRRLSSGEETTAIQGRSVTPRAGDSPRRRPGEAGEAAWRAASLDARLRAVERAELLGQLAGGAVHDLNNILTAVVGYCELLLEGLEDGGTLHGYAEQAHGGARRAAELAREVLTIGAAEGSAAATLDVGAELLGMRPVIERLLAPRIECVLREHGQLPPARIDPGAFARVLLNLVVNARDAMPEGGRVTIGAERADVDDAEARRRELSPGRYVLLTVSDTGAGIDPEILDRVFEPFFTTKGRGGTGLGLTAVRRLVRQAGGAVAVASQRGEWTSVAVHLPAA